MSAAPAAPPPPPGTTALSSPADSDSNASDDEVELIYSRNNSGNSKNPIARLKRAFSARKPEPESRGNPFKSLSDIVEAAHVGEADDDELLLNFALFQPELQSRPMVASVLGTLVRQDEVPAEGDAEFAAPSDDQVPDEGMGMLLGVFVPTVQNIFGVILFLRLSWIVGVCGIGEAFLLVLLCCLSTILTAISMSAVATNGYVPAAGGAYYMMSRVLGPAFGGVVGALQFFGNTFTAAMNILGCIEILLTYMAPGMSLFGPDQPDGAALYANMRVYGLLILIGVGIIAYFGEKYIDRLSYACFAVTVLSIASMFLGFMYTQSQAPTCTIDGDLMNQQYPGHCNASDAALFPSWQSSNTSYVRQFGIPGLGSGVFARNGAPMYTAEGEFRPGQAPVDAQQREFSIVADITSSFTVLVGIFFPSVTGVMASTNLSGKLKDPTKAIPRGTIASVTTMTVVYLAAVLFMGGIATQEVLADKYGESYGGQLFVARVGWPSSWVILIGALISTFGSAIQCLMGGPPVLRAIAMDNIIPVLAPFARLWKGEPTRALGMTVLICALAIIIAQLDLVAPLVTMCYLMCDIFVNLACTLQSLLRSPSWRPRYKYYHWSLSALGFLLSVALMFIVSWLYSVVVIVLSLVIYEYIEYTGAAKEWGDGLRGLSMQAARYSLLRLEDSPPDGKNWRVRCLSFDAFELTSRRSRRCCCLPS